MRTSAPAWTSTGALLLDHLVRPRENCLGDGESEHLRGLRIDRQLELGGLLDRQITRLRPLRILSTKYGARRYTPFRLVPYDITDPASIHSAAGHIVRKRFFAARSRPSAWLIESATYQSPQNWV
jgi:hypothetical protein